MNEIKPIENDKPKTKLMIATPAFDGKVNIPYTLSFANTYLACAANDIEIQPLIVTSGSLLVAERNRIVEAFYQSDCTHLLMVDSDLGWPPQAVLSMLEMDREFIGGAYPARSDKENTFLFRPITEKDGRLVNDKHLLKMNYIPAGFLLLSRSCIEKMRKHFPELYFEPKNKEVNNPSPGYCFFNTEVWEGEFWGEDFVFCRRARAAGIDIWVDPLIQFDHAGKVGMLLDVLTTDPTGKTNVKPIELSERKV